MGGFSEVAVGEDVAGAQVDEVGAVGKLSGHGHAVVVLASGERSGAEGQTVVLVGHGIKHPLDVLGSADDARQTEHRVGRVVGVDTHIDVVFVADGHNGLQPVFHVLLQLLLVNALIEL